MLRKKGRNPLALQILTVLFWFGGEIGGGIMAVVILAIQGQQVQDFDLTIYIGAIVGAAVGVGFVFLIAHLIPPTEEHLARAYAGYSPGAMNPSTPTSANPYNPYDGSGPQA